ncbi:MAG: penicillin-binding protein transpeptidase, partial [Bryobacterales bacterium]|nr:penicillin-binding protein transpeptidase [Bryobacterales bacterium]
MHLNCQAIARFLTILAASATTLLHGATTTQSAKHAAKKITAKSSGKTSRKTTSLRKSVPIKSAAFVAKTTSSVSVRKAVFRKTSSIGRGPWRVPNYAPSAEGDFSEGDDLIARRAAVDALGRLNGSVVMADADSGRILTVVNQRLAYKNGFQPCSTIKVPVALAALSETVVDRLTKIRIYGNTKVAMTEALARSNNQYFASLGEKLGFERMTYYARLFGLGEKASLDIEEEQPGILPSETPKSGMGMMTSFGDGITITPLEMAGLMGAVANGGTLYYLQYPKSQQLASTMIPQVKRRLDIDSLIPEIKPGMMGAVEYGTARRIGFDPNEPIYGKTGTCTDTRTPTHLGWFGSFTEVADQRVVVVVLLTGGSAVSGPTAAGVAGQVYRNLDAGNYFAKRQNV